MESKAAGIENEDHETMSSKYRLLFTIAIIVIGFNLRPAITAVGALLGMIRDQIGLANWGAGMITSLPLIAFAVMSTIASKIGIKFGNVRTIFLGLLLLLIGICIRSIPFTLSLLVGTAIIGVGIAIMNVLLPAVIKEKFPDQIGKMTSYYSTAMVVFAATGSGLTVSLAENAGLGWELSLLSWSLLTLFGILIWFFVMRLDKTITSDKPKVEINIQIGGSLLKSSLAWQVTLFMGLQSLAFYVMISWLPEMLQDFGFSIIAAGWLVSYAQFISLPATFLAPLLAERYTNQQGLVLTIGCLYIFGFTGLLIGGNLPLLIFWVTLMGIASGGSISLSLALLGMRVRNAKQAGELSGMAQSIGYVLAAIGPLLIGLLYDLTQTWSIPLITMIILCVLMTIVGLGAGRDQYIEEEELENKAN